MDPKSDAVIAAWYNVAHENHRAEWFEISYVAFRSILSGNTLTVSELAGALGRPLEDFWRIVEVMASEDRLALDESGHVITGAGGLSLVESPYRLEMNNRTYWSWCALDAVGIPAGLNIDATVLSRCVDTGVPVKVDIVSGNPARTQPEEVAISLLPPTAHQPPACECCCPAIDFYQKLANIPAHVSPVSIAQAMDLGRRLWQDSVPR